MQTVIAGNEAGSMYKSNFKVIITCRYSLSVIFGLNVLRLLNFAIHMSIVHGYNFFALFG